MKFIEEYLEGFLIDFMKLSLEEFLEQFLIETMDEFRIKLI